MWTSYRIKLSFLVIGLSIISVLPSISHASSPTTDKISYNRNTDTDVFLDNYDDGPGPSAWIYETNDPNSFPIGSIGLGTPPTDLPISGTFPDNTNYQIVVENTSDCSSSTISQCESYPDFQGVTPTFSIANNPLGPNCVPAGSRMAPATQGCYIDAV